MELSCLKGLSGLVVVLVSPDSSDPLIAFFRLICQGRKITMGMPMAESRYRSLTVLSENEKVSEAFLANSMMATQAVN